MFVKKCLSCNKNFRTYKSQNNKFCSIFCYRKLQSEISKRAGFGKWMLGRKLSESTKNKLKGKLSPNKGIIGVKHHSLEIKNKISLASKLHWKNSFYKEKVIAGLKKSWHDGQRANQKKYEGSRHWNWKGGITPEVRRLRNSAAYNEWRLKILTRDKFECQMPDCEDGKPLHANHIKVFSAYPQIRFDLQNGITLCKPCHVTIRKSEHLYENLFNKIIEHNNNLIKT